MTAAAASQRPPRRACRRGFAFARQGFWLLLAVLAFGRTAAQTSQETFGQNRVQYRDFDWQYYATEHFVTYFNQGGQELGRFAAQMAEIDLREIEELLDFRVNREINIIVYNTVGDQNQSNIGASRQVVYNTGGRTTIIDNKLFLHFNGSHQDMRRQLREGIARILLENMIFGGNLQEIVQNAVLLHLPEWFTEGLVAYVGEEWNADLDDQLRDAIGSGRYDKFNKLTGDDARFAGHSLWYFIAEKYGAANIPNLLYLIRVNRSLENGFLFVLGAPVDQVIADWQAYYARKYEEERAVREEPLAERRIDKRFRKRFDYHSPSLAPRADRLAYVTDDEGRFKVRVQELGPDAGKGNKVVHRGGFKTRNLARDLTYPLLAWDRTGQRLAMVYERRSRTMLVLYDLEEKQKEVKELPRFQRVQSMSFTERPHQLVLSALNRGQSDIYLYDTRNGRQQQITNDHFDDLDPVWIEADGRSGILFASNRMEDTLVNRRQDSVLPVGNLDLWFWNADRGRRLLRITDTRDAQERQPVQIDEGHFGFTSDGSGIRNRYAGYFDTVYDYTAVTVFFRDSVAFGPRYDLKPWQEAGLIDSVWERPVYKDTAVAFPVTNFSRNLREHAVAPRAGKAVDLFTIEGRNEFQLHDLPRNLEALRGDRSLPKTAFRRYTNAKGEASGEPERPESTELPEGDFWFQSPFERVPLQERTLKLEARPLEETLGAPRENLVSGLDFQRSRIRPYRVQYATETVTTQLDNSLFFNRYQRFDPGSPRFRQPSLNGLFSVSITDLFEDYRFLGAFRIPTGFNGSDYLIRFEDNSRRLDLHANYYYHADRGTTVPEAPLNNRIFETRNRTNIATVTGIWPFDVIRSVRFHGSYRNDKQQVLATDILSLDQPNVKEDWVSAKVEYVHDNTVLIGTNLPEGLRFKAWYEMHKGFEVNVTDRFNLSFNDGFLGVVGFDARHYLRVHRNIIWANRVAGASSFGASRMVYFLGGVESWFNPRWNTETVVDPEAGYAFQNAAVNLRGHDQNIRNGNSYALWNSELRVPLFSYLINKPIRSELIRNFMVTGFFDAGSAWRGWTPFDAEDRLNTVVVENGPITTTVEFFRNPFVFGYGWGARTVLFGYYLRFDMAWGVDTGEPVGPSYLWSLSLDF